ncbi:MAG: phosphate/phosphite/phosphonate ABC transporter substrate-binding protein [Nitrospinae bacterium]|nr:phosphate/phosphite/phosphonate ABC transporter substrate-binding protein [Nitrospinota bacterium]
MFKSNLFFLRRLFPLLFFLLILSCGKGKEEEILGSSSNPIKIYFTPSIDAGAIASNSAEFLKFLEEETKYYFKSGIPSSYITVVEALGSKRADVAVMNSFGYLLAHQKYGAEARITVIRNGHKFYKGQIIAHIDSGINKIEDIQGKRFAFTDSSSTSGYLFPMKILKEHGVEPGNTVFGMKHDNVVTMVYQRQVDAGATFHSPPDENGNIKDARSLVLTQFPDAAEKIKIIAVTEDIMNDPFVFRKDLPGEITEKVIAAILKFMDTEAGKKVFKTIYGVDGVVRSSDADYDGLRKMVEINKIDPAELLRKK